ERDLTAGESSWSGSPGMAQGDLALLCRRPLDTLSADAMVRLTAMSFEQAQELKRRTIGSDLSALLQITGVYQDRPASKSFWKRQSAQVSCTTRQLAQLRPPIKLSEFPWGHPQLFMFPAFRASF